MISRFLRAAVWALPWWVDPADADELAAALAALWPDCPLEIVVGPVEPGVDGLWRDGAQLVLTRDGDTERRDAPADPWTSVALVRSWLRAVDLPAAAPAPAAPPPPEPAPVEAATWGRGTFGPGFRVPDSAPILWADVTMAVGDRWFVGAYLHNEGAEAPMTDGAPLHAFRFGAGPTIGHRWGTLPRYAVEAAVTARAARTSTLGFGPAGHLALSAAGPGASVRPVARLGIVVDPDGAGGRPVATALTVGVIGGAP